MLWSRFSLVSVSCQRLLSEERAFPGETIELKLHVVNRKAIAPPWITGRDEIPLGLAPDLAEIPGSRPVPAS